MAGLSVLTRSFADLQTIQANAYSVAAGLAQIPAASLGTFTPLGGIFNATATAALGIQSQIDYVYTISRLLTSSGPDVDSYIAPFGIAREGAGLASNSGTYTLNSPVAGRTLAFKVGTLISRSDDGFQYQVVSDISGSNAAYDPLSQAYYFQASGAQTISFSFQALIAGSIGNCDAGEIDVPYGGPGSTSATLTGTITNPLPVSNGTDAEIDSAYITRFQAIMAGGAVGTARAYLAAALGVAPDLTVQIGDTLDASGAEKLSWFTVFVNVLGQSAGPSSTIVSDVQQAVEAVRAAGTRFTVVSPTLVSVTISGLIKADGTVPTGTALANAAASATAFVNNLGMIPIENDGSVTTMGVPLDLIRRAIAATNPNGSSANGVAYTSNLQINGGYGDLTVGYGQQAIVTSCNFTAE